AAGFRALDDAQRKAEMYRKWHLTQTTGLGRHQAMELIGDRGTATREPFEAALLAMGEESGSLDESLRLLADYFAAKHTLMLRVRKMLTYPLFLSLCTVVLLPLPLVFLGKSTAYFAIVL